MSQRRYASATDVDTGKLLAYATDWGWFCTWWGAPQKRGITRSREKASKAAFDYAERKRR